jgi:hypothetical protein
LQYILKEGEPPIVSSKQELYEMVTSFTYPARPAGDSA